MLRYLKKKVHGLARSPNFENGIAPPLGVLGRKFFGVLNNSLGGTSGPSMSKIGDVRVPNHFDPCWNCPIALFARFCFRERETNRQIDRQTDRQTERQTDRQIKKDRSIDKRTD